MQQWEAKWESFALDCSSQSSANNCVQSEAPRQRWVPELVTWNESHSLTWVTSDRVYRSTTLTTMSLPRLCSTTLTYHRKPTTNNETLHAVYHPGADPSPPDGTTRWQHQTVESSYLKAHSLRPHHQPRNTKNTPHSDSSSWIYWPHPPSSRCIPRIEPSFRITQRDRSPGHGGKSRAAEKEKEKGRVLRWNKRGAAAVPTNWSDVCLAAEEPAAPRDLS